MATTATVANMAVLIDEHRMLTKIDDAYQDFLETHHAEADTERFTKPREDADSRRSDVFHQILMLNCLDFETSKLRIAYLIESDLFDTVIETAAAYLEGQLKGNASA